MYLRPDYLVDVCVVTREAAVIHFTREPDNRKTLSSTGVPGQLIAAYETDVERALTVATVGYVTVFLTCSVFPCRRERRKLLLTCSFFLSLISSLPIDNKQCVLCDSRTKPRH